MSPLTSGTKGETRVRNAEGQRTSPMRVMPTLPPVGGTSQCRRPDLGHGAAHVVEVKLAERGGLLARKDSITPSTPSLSVGKKRPLK
jgi:hypothetical protein